MNLAVKINGCTDNVPYAALVFAENVHVSALSFDQFLFISSKLLTL